MGEPLHRDMKHVGCALHISSGAMNIEMSPHVAFVYYIVTKVTKFELHII